MKIIADTHCHTVASNHAYSTLQELVNEASKKHLYAIAITDHAKSMPASPGKWYFKNLPSVPEVLENVRVLKGIELNVLDHLGNLDDDLEETSVLDWKIASIHDFAYKGERSFEAITNTWLEIAKNPYINVIGHCELENFKFDYEKVIPEFGKNGKLVEINNASFNIRKNSVKNLVDIVSICKKNAVEVIVNSDAHFSANLGVFEHSLNLLKEMDFPEKLVVNADIDRFKTYLSERGIKC